MKMKLVDIEHNRIRNKPYNSAILIRNGTSENQGFIIEHLELREYIERSDPKLGKYSLITVLLKTNRGIAEMKYDEGYRTNEALESEARILTQYVGFGSLINRALIELQGK
jgi:hypothetical protein